jgi:hypothetical protein
MLREVLLRHSRVEAVVRPHSMLFLSAAREKDSLRRPSARSACRGVPETSMNVMRTVAICEGAPVPQHTTLVSAQRAAAVMVLAPPRPGPSCIAAASLVCTAQPYKSPMEIWTKPPDDGGDTSGPCRHRWLSEGRAETAAAHRALARNCSSGLDVAARTR